MFNITNDQDGERLIEQEPAPSIKKLISDNFSLDKGLLPNVGFVFVIIVLISCNIFVRDKTAQYKAQNELLNKDIIELKIENDASLFRIESINKKDHILNVLQQHNIDLKESTVPNRILQVQNPLITH